MVRCLTLLVISIMQIKNTMRCYFSHWLKFKKMNTSKHWAGMWSNYAFVVGIKNATTTLENCLAVHYIFKHMPTLWPSNSTRRYLSKEIKIKKACMWQFIAALSIIAKKRNSPNNHQQENRLTICDKSTQWNNIQQQKNELQNANEYIDESNQ